MSKCEKIGNALVCLPDDDERMGNSIHELYDCFSELLETAEELEEQRHTLESGLLAAANQLLALVKGLSEVRLKERKIRYTCEAAKEELDKIVELCTEQREKLREEASRRENLKANE